MAPVATITLSIHRSCVVDPMGEPVWPMGAA
jgi:hypothetical protein